MCEGEGANRWRLEVSSGGGLKDGVSSGGGKWKVIPWHWEPPDEGVGAYVRGRHVGVDPVASGSVRSGGRKVEGHPVEGVVVDPVA